MGIVSLVSLVSIFLVLMPLLYNIFINNSDFFTEAFRTLGNTFDIVIGSFQLFTDIGTVLPGRIYPIYVFCIGMLFACFAIWFLHLIFQIISSFISFS